jgi:hypothetical protein
MNEDLRRIPRLKVCCQVSVRDRYGVWTAVTEDVSAHGCRIVTPRLLRNGTLLDLTIASDLFPDELESQAITAWAAPQRLAVEFIQTRRRAGSLTPEQWVELLLEHGATRDTRVTSRLVPSISSRPSPRSATVRDGRVVLAFDAASPTAASDAIPHVPLRRA